MPSKKKSENALTLTQLASQLLKFYREIIEPGTRKIVSEEISEEIGKLRNEMNGRFDDLYKKFEDLRQEYIIANAQMKRIERSEEVLKKDVLDLKNKVSELQRKIEAFEKRLPH